MARPSAGIGHFEMDAFGAWNWQYNILLTGGEKPQHIAVDYSQANPVLYVTPAAAVQNHLYAIVDSGATTYSQTTVATAPATQMFRGVAMAPTVPGAPVFTVQPQGQTNNYGDNVTFGPVAASGANPNGFTWRHSGTNLLDGPTGTGSVISGATSNTLTISGIGIADRGCYYAVAQNNGPNPATSDCAFLELIGSCINPKPLPATLCAGSTANFIGGTAGCPQPVGTPSWTWNAGFGDIPVNDGPGPSGFSTVSGATTTSLTIANVQDGDAGLYKLTVIDGLSQPSVAGAALVVADPPSFVFQPVNQTKVGGQTASFEVVASGNALTYVWKKNASPINDGPTGNGSTIAGAHTATLWITNVVGQDVGTYTCTVSNVCGTALTSDPATLTVGYAPVITVPPVSLIVTAGQTAVFTATVTGTETINYSWKHNADPIGDDGHYSGTGTPTLTVNNVQVADAQSYTITAVNDYGTASATAVLRFVLAEPQPSGIPGLVIYEPFNYPTADYVQNAAVNSWQDFISTWNQVTGEPAWWERLGQGASTVRDSGIPVWPGIDCINDREWYWSSAPNNNHLKFGGIHQSNGAAVLLLRF